MRLFLASVLVILGVSIAGADKSPSASELKSSTEQLEKAWNNTKVDYKKRFKSQMAPIEEKIKELKEALDNGDPAKRKQINDDLKEVKELRDRIRKEYHEITVASIFDVTALQKHFINAKDDTQD
jgi:hypothetical protein